MSPDSALLKQLLNALLDQHEQPNRQRVARIKITPDKHAHYFDEVEIRDRLHNELWEMQARGWVQLHWIKRQTHLLETVTLEASGATALFEWLRRVPRTDQHTALRNQLTAQAPRPGWHTAFIAHIHQQIETHKNPAPLKLDDAAFNAEMFSTLAALADLSEPVLERVFSVRVLNDSKRLESLKPAILQVLRRFSPHAQDVPDDDRALLAAH